MHIPQVNMRFVVELQNRLMLLVVKANGGNDTNECKKQDNPNHKAKFDGYRFSDDVWPTRH